MKFAVYGNQITTVNSKDELVTFLRKMTVDTDNETFMKNFSKRARLLGQKISTNSVDSFIESLVYYGHVKLLKDDDSCA